MKTLELQQMENLTGLGGGFWSGMACAGTILAAGAFLVGTGGAGALVSAYAAGAACGGLIGYGAASGNWA